MQPIPVICDRCRAEGEAGGDNFADFGDLLDFEPVPRRPRVDGWTPDLQRAFIAALAVTGSPRRAAAAVGKSAFGVDQLLKAKGAEGFCAAYHRALAMAGEKRRARLETGFDSAVKQDSVRAAPPPAPWARARRRAMLDGPPRPYDPADDDTPESRRAFLEHIFIRYSRKIRQERTARLEGRIVEADFYLRQVTWLEVAIDACSESGGFGVLASLRVGGVDVIQVAETPFSKLMDDIRRTSWAELDEPERPEHPPLHYLAYHDGYATEPLESLSGGRGVEDVQAQERAYRERHAADAREQVEWEAQARRAYEERRDSDASS